MPCVLPAWKLEAIKKKKKGTILNATLKQGTQEPSHMYGHTNFYSHESEAHQKLLEHL